MGPIIRYSSICNVKIWGVKCVVGTVIRNLWWRRRGLADREIINVPAFIKAQGVAHEMESNLNDFSSEIAEGKGIKLPATAGSKIKCDRGVEIRPSVGGYFYEEKIATGFSLVIGQKSDLGIGGPNEVDIGGHQVLVVVIRIKSRQNRAPIIRLAACRRDYEPG